MKNWLAKIRLWEIALAVFLGFGAYLLWTTTQVTKQLGQQASIDLYNVGSAAYNFNAGELTTFDNLNRLCGTGKPCGTFADLDRTLASVRLAAGQVTALSQYEKPQLEALNKQEAQLFSDAHSAITNFVIFEVSLNNTAVGLQDLEKELGLELDALHKTTMDVDDVVTDPELQRIILNTAGISGHLDGLTGDIQAKTHELIYPEPCHGKICWVKRTYSIVKGVVQLGEPAYYWGSLSTDVFK